MGRTKREIAFALVEEELRDARCAVGQPYSDDFFWTPDSGESLLDALEKKLSRRAGLKQED